MLVVQRHSEVVFCVFKCHKRGFEFDLRVKIVLRDLCLLLLGGGQELETFRVDFAEGPSSWSSSSLNLSGLADWRSCR